MTEQRAYQATAFLSCSLRDEDAPFVQHVVDILAGYRIKAIGTVGKYDVAPESPAVTMKKNIPNCDFVVVVATPRYFQKDIATGQTKYSLSEQIHVESGIAYAYDKPVIAFVKEGTDVGNFIPAITQYLVLKGSFLDYLFEGHKIRRLIKNTFNVIEKIRSVRGVRNVGKMILYSLAVYGAYQLAKRIFK